MMWGISTHIDLYGCDSDLITCRKTLERFSGELVEFLKMKAHGAPVIEWFGNGNTEGFTLVQLLTTSCITAHFSESYRESAFIDIFSCKEYNAGEAVIFCAEFFKASVYHSTGIIRGGRAPERFFDGGSTGEQRCGDAVRDNVRDFPNMGRP